MRLRWTLITAAASALAPRWQPRSLGQTDLKTQVPLGIGTWQAGNRLLYDYSPARDAALLEAWSSAAKNGVSYFDSGDSYGTGELEGNAETLLGRFSETTANVCVHTKLATYPWRLRAEDFVAACEESKRRTGGVALVGQLGARELHRTLHGGDDLGLLAVALHAVGAHAVAQPVELLLHGLPAVRRRRARRRHV